MTTAQAWRRLARVVDRATGYYLCQHNKSLRIQRVIWQDLGSYMFLGGRPMWVEGGPDVGEYDGRAARVLYCLLNAAMCERKKRKK